MTERKIIIAIDGYSSCGKSTFARAIASEIGYLYIDSGAMYRAVTLYCMRNNLINDRDINREIIVSSLLNIHIDFVFNPDLKSYETFLNSENVESEIRGIEVSQYVSSISRIPEVRTRMVELQREIGAFKGIVMDGRDIGTVVFPDAELKIFMTASVDIRAERRYKELKEKNMDVNFEEIKQNIIARDITDENRDISPLRKADDAILLDNSRMTMADQMVWFSDIFNNMLNDH